MNNYKIILTMKNTNEKEAHEQEILPKDKKEGNLYDKILHEIGDSTVLPIVQDCLGIEPLKIKIVKPKMQTTLEREVDECYWIKTKENRNILLHIEYQSRNDDKMVERVGLYAAMMRFYNPKILIESVVVYVGDDEPTMRTELFEDEVYYGFVLINAKTFDHKELLASENPRQVITAILGDYAIEDSEEIIRCIIRRLRKVCKSEKELIKSSRQLLVLSFLRNLGTLTEKILEHMAVHIDIAATEVFKNAYRNERAEYMRKAKEELEKERLRNEQERLEKEMSWQATILSLAKHTKLTAEQIAVEAKIPLLFVLNTMEEFKL